MRRKPDPIKLGLEVVMLSCVAVMVGMILGAFLRLPQAGALICKWMGFP